MPVPLRIIESLEVAASIAGRLVSRLLILKASVESRGDGLQKLADEVQAIGNVLLQVSDILQADWDSVGFNNVFSGDVQIITEATLEALSQLDGDLVHTDELMSNKGSTFGKVSLNSAEQVQWRFLQARMRDRRAQLGDLKVNMDLILTTTTLAKVVKSTSSNADSELSSDETRELMSAVTALRREATLLGQKGRRHMRVQSTIMDTAIPAQVVRPSQREARSRSSSGASRSLESDPSTGSRTSNNISHISHISHGVKPRSGSVHFAARVSEQPSQFGPPVPDADVRDFRATYHPPSNMTPSRPATTSSRIPIDAVNESAARSRRPVTYQPRQAEEDWHIEPKKRRGCWSQMWAALRTDRSEITARRKPPALDSTLDINPNRLKAWTFVATPALEGDPYADAFNDLHFNIMQLPLNPIEVHDLLAQRSHYHTSILRELGALNHRQRRMVLSHVQKHDLNLLSVYCDRRERLSTALGHVQAQILIWITSRNDLVLGEKENYMLPTPDFGNRSFNHRLSRLYTEFEQRNPEHAPIVEESPPTPTASRPRRTQSESTPRPPSPVHTNPLSRHSALQPCYRSSTLDTPRRPMPPGGVVHYSRPFTQQFPPPQAQNPDPSTSTPTPRASVVLEPPPRSARRNNNNASPQRPTPSSERRNSIRKRTRSALQSTLLPSPIPEAVSPHLASPRRILPLPPPSGRVYPAVANGEGILVEAEDGARRPYAESAASGLSPKVVISPSLLSPVGVGVVDDGERESSSAGSDEVVAELLGRWTGVLEGDGGDGSGPSHSHSHADREKW